MADLHILFFPFMAPGHFQPLLHMAERFASRDGVRVSILTTPANAPAVQPFLRRAAGNTELHIVPFGSAEAGLPEGCENLSLIPSLDLCFNFYTAVLRLQNPFAKVLRDLLPDCVVTDALFHWSYAVAAELGIPRLVFHPTCIFSICVAESLASHKTLIKNMLARDAESTVVVIPGLPHGIEMLVSQLPPPESEEHEIFKLMREADAKSYGTVVNSFSELDSDYLECLGRKAWPLGPVAPLDRGGESHECMKWLDSKSPGSVLYVCFGSRSLFRGAQIRELALGLETCNHPFVWVVSEDVDKEWNNSRGGFEERVGGKGLVIRGWAPQVAILNHPSVGGFLTHCGWNSCLEGVTAGLPFVTWPTNLDDLWYNERLIVQVLRIGISVGAKKRAFKAEDYELMEADTVKKAVDELMGRGQEADLRRERARELGEKARKAVLKGGSSYVNMTKLIQELIDHRNTRTQAAI